MPYRLGWKGLVVFRYVFVSNIQISTDDFSVWLPAATNVVSKLVPHRFHWKNIHIELPSHCLALIFDNRQKPSPLLESLAVMDLMEHDLSVTFPSLLKIGEAIRLRRCAFNGFSVGPIEGVKYRCQKIFWSVSGSCTSTLHKPEAIYDRYQW